MGCTTLFVSFVLVTALAKAQNNLEVRIANIKNDKGELLIGLYTDEANFPRKTTDGKIVKASKDVVIVEFQDLKPGAYAISVLHDENSNKDMDQNKIGIPKEGFGFSNNARASFGPPSFDKAKIFLHSKDTLISIDLKYLGRKRT